MHLTQSRKERKEGQTQVCVHLAFGQCNGPGKYIYINLPKTRALRAPRKPKTIYLTPSRKGRKEAKKPIAVRRLSLLTNFLITDNQFSIFSCSSLRAWRLGVRKSFIRVYRRSSVSH